MPKTGDTIGPYTLLSKLGRGAFGVVWLAEKRSVLATTKVALKLPNDEDVEIEAVKQEAAIWVHASGHPNVLPIIDADVYDKHIVIVSEYAPDGSLSKWLEANGGKAPTTESAIEMALGILAGLEHLHGRGIIHRDLKPDNILLQGSTPRLADFGIARVLKSTSKSTVATGTPAYMSPEAFDGKRNQQTDIWSAGVIFYQLISGDLPFHQADIASLLAAIVTKDQEPLPASIPEQIRDVIQRALEKDPNQRWQSAGEMKSALRRAIRSIEFLGEKPKQADLIETIRPADSDRIGPIIAPTIKAASPIAQSTIIARSPAALSRNQERGDARAATPRRSKTLVTSLAAGLALVFLFSAIFFGLPSSCRRRSGGFVIVLSDNIKTIDPIGSPTVDAASERVRVLMFNSLVKKNDQFDYVPELASNIQRSDDGLTFTFTLRDGVTFHDGRQFTSADAKYTLDTVLANPFAKSASFFEGAGANRTNYIKSVEAPDARTLVITLTKQWTGLLPNLVPISIIPKDSYESQKTHPLGTGPFKFKSYDQSQQVVDLEANASYWDGPPQMATMRARVISDSNAMQAELQSGRVDIAPLPTSLSPDAIKALGSNPNLAVHQFTGSNVNLLTFNTREAPLDNVKVRQAIAHAVDREGLIRDLLLSQGKIAHSILPESSWAYTPGQTYNFDPAAAKRLLDEAGLRDPDGDGPQMRISKPMLFRISGSSAPARQYAGVIQNYLKNVGLPVSIEATEFNVMLEFVRRGQFQMTYGQWVGGNQDPIFYRDLFATSEIPTEARASRNRSRYSNSELDQILTEAANTYDHDKAKPLYARAQEIVSRDVPILPLWYQANMVIAKKSVANINVNASGDWGFVKNLTVPR